MPLRPLHPLPTLLLVYTKIDLGTRFNAAVQNNLFVVRQQKSADIPKNANVTYLIQMPNGGPQELVSIPWLGYLFFFSIVIFLLLNSLLSSSVQWMDGWMDSWAWMYLCLSLIYNYNLLVVTHLLFVFYHQQ
eukprot:GEZU01025042.1.p1 GENE.GEZU01025042.1~~GEZU01025042.1.p1  ORF type:complete len:132 (+),score=3.01 GEZU01025042.1:399-794(+)